MIQVAKYKLELVKESNARYNFEDRKISSPLDASRLAREIFRMDNQAEEVFGILTLDTKNSINGVFEVSRGCLNSSIVHPREVFKRAILNNANSIMLIHNHPSGETTPSHEDTALTNRLIECGKILGVFVIDHIIIGGDNYLSFKEEGLL